MTPKERDIHAAKMRLREAAGRLERIRRLPKRNPVQRATYGREIAKFWQEVRRDRELLKKKGKRWPQPLARSTENTPSA